MIIDKIQNASFYYGLGEKYIKAFNFIQNNNLEDFENGKYKIDGEDIFINIQDYNTKSVEESKFEAHKKYADIQFIIKGSEKLGYGDINEFEEVTKYDEEKDIVFLNGQGNFAKAEENTFIIFMPQDAHMPCIQVDSPAYVKKAVVKIKL